MCLINDHLRQLPDAEHGLDENTSYDEQTGHAQGAGLDRIPNSRLAKTMTRTLVLVSCRRLQLLLILGYVSLAVSFVNVRVETIIDKLPTVAATAPVVSHFRYKQQQRLSSLSVLHLFGRSKSDSATIELQNLTLDDEETIRSLFAWVCCAFSEDEDPRYNNLMLAFAAIFGTNLPNDSVPVKLLRHARQRHQRLQQEEQPLMMMVGESLSQHERESASLGAMGAAQWTGQWQTRPHALLETKDYPSIDDWERSLSRGCRRSLQRSRLQNFTVIARPILNHRPAPHSTYDHFRCVVEHEVRLLASTGDMNAFLSALSAGISRYMGTTQMTGEIREYRDTETNRVLAFAHEVRKGRTLRGQWFYGTNEASKRYIWFHSVRSCVERAIESKDLDVVDLGPSGSDAFSVLKAKYGFRSFVNWPSIADYSGPFWDYERQAPAVNGLTY
jgi:hypothetical protein